MATREELYRKFGPKMIEALIQLLRDKVPELGAFTSQQIMDALDNKIEAIPDYDWMNPLG